MVPSEEREAIKMNRKIRVIGKICRIISSVMTVLSIIAASALVITGVVLAVVPQDGVYAEVSASADVTVKGKWIDKIPDGDVEKFSRGIREGTTELNVEGLNVGDAERTADGIVLHADGNPSDFTLRRVGRALIAYSFIPGALIAVFIMLGKLMKELETGESPFTDRVIGRMRNFAISLIPFALIKPSAESVVRSIMSTGNFNLNFGDFDLSVVFGALIIILLIMIFKYGAQIQRESDETL